LRAPKGDANYRYRKYCNFLGRSIFADTLEIPRLLDKYFTNHNILGYLKNKRGTE
jgi:hypothetical protein